ncbi:MAG TPA: HIT family protein [Magnetospirillaceae bacterium]|nr:HIT family protein [Magnetospirillaceae bacterium]
MQPTIFTKIIRGELPAHKVYEDPKTLAFLNIHPSRPGHTLVVPKVQVADLHELADDDYIALMHTVKKVAARQAEVFGADYKICLKVMGFDIPHVHVHVLPCQTPADFAATEDMSEPDHAALSAMAERLAF